MSVWQRDVPPVFCRYCGARLVDDTFTAVRRGFDPYTGRSEPSATYNVLRCPHAERDNDTHDYWLLPTTRVES